MFILYFILQLILGSCRLFYTDGSSVETRTIFSEQKISAPQNYSVLIISDLHLGSCEDFPFSKMMTEIQNHTFPQQDKILFCAVLGDIANHADEKEYREFLRFKTCFEEKNIKVFSVPGNHDFYDSPNHGENYKKYIGEFFYRLTVNNHSYYFLDTADGYMGNSQFKILETEFKKDQNLKTVFSHNPFFTKDIFSKMLDFQECAKIANLLSVSNVDYYFCGHVHIPEVNEFSNFSEVIIDRFSSEYAILSILENSSSYSIVKF